MAHTKSAKKRVRQNERQRLHNRGLKGRMRTAVKAVEKAVGASDPAAAAAALSGACAEIEKAGRKGLIHPNAAARKKSRLAKRVARTSKG